MKYMVGDEVWFLDHDGNMQFKAVNFGSNSVVRRNPLWSDGSIIIGEDYKLNGAKIVGLTGDITYPYMVKYPSENDYMGRKEPCLAFEERFLTLKKSKEVTPADRKSLLSRVTGLLNMIRGYDG